MPKENKNPCITCNNVGAYAMDPKTFGITKPVACPECGLKGVAPKEEDSGNG